MFVRSRLSTKLVVLVLLAMGMVALGILMPMLALQMVDQYFAAGLAGVVLLWLVGSATRRRPRTAAVPVSAATPKSEVSAAPAELASDIVIEDEAESREGDEDHA